MTVPRSRFLHLSVFGAAQTMSHTVQALNLPGFAIELTCDRLSGAFPSTWTPKGIDFLTWRALMFPIYCIPFWWFVGFGFEKATKLSWPPLLCGSLLCVAFAILGLGLRFGLSASEREGIVYPIWGFALWTLLFAIFPVSWIRKVRLG